MKEKEVMYNLTSKFFSQLKHWAFVLFFKKAFRRLSNFTKNELLHIVCTTFFQPLLKHQLQKKIVYLPLLKIFVQFTNTVVPHSIDFGNFAK